MSCLLHPSSREMSSSLLYLDECSGQVDRSDADFFCVCLRQALERRPHTYIDMLRGEEEEENYARHVKS